MEEEGDGNDGAQNRLGECEVCGDEALYTCPRCELKTCSAKCVNIHKKELECSGERDKTSFVPLSKFTNLNLLNDYRFLEDASRTIDNCRRNPLKKFTRYRQPLPPHLQKLRRAALARKTTIQYLPQHFTRHKENTTFLHFATSVIYWRLELIFPQAGHIKVVLEKCDENERLSSVISKFVDYDTCPELYRKSLKFYHSAGVPGMEVLLQAEYVQTKPSFFLLDISSTLKENFENRIIIEYPVLYIIPKSHKDEYLILDADMEVDTDAGAELRRKFSEFTPFTYFDTVAYKPLKNSAEMKSINSSAAELRKYFYASESDNETEETAVAKPERKRTRNPRKPFFKAKKLNIPTYEDLIQQNS